VNVNFYYAAPAATKGSAFFKLKHKGGHAEGVTPKKPVWRRKERSGSATSGFWRGRASAGTIHRQGKRNMFPKRLQQGSALLFENSKIILKLVQKKIGSEKS